MSTVCLQLSAKAVGSKQNVFDAHSKITPISFAPFDAKNRRTEAVVEQGGVSLHLLKGAVRTIAEACGLQPREIDALEARVSVSATKGYRTLAVARGTGSDVPSFLGLVSLYDPPRPDAKLLLTGTALTYFDISGLTPLPWWQAAAIFLFAMAACLGVNDAAKVAMIRRRVPAAAHRSGS